MPDPAVPAPRPLTAEDWAELKTWAPWEIGPVMFARIVATVEELQAEVARLTADLAATPVVYARNCDDCPGGIDWQQRAEQAEADLAATTTQRDAAYSVVRRTRDNWEPVLEEGIWRRCFFTQVAPKLVADHEDDPMTPDEAAVLDTIRDSDDG